MGGVADAYMLPPWVEPAVHGWWALAGFYAYKGAYKITQELEALHDPHREPLPPGAGHPSGREPRL